MKNYWLLGASLAAVMTLSACGDSEENSAENEGGEGAPGESTSIELGYVQYAESIAMASVWEILLTEQGYDVNMTTMEKQFLFSGVENHEIDIAFSAWMPFTDANLLEGKEDSIVIHDPWFEGTSLGLVVPEYMEGVNTITDLNDQVEELSGEITGIDAGAALTERTYEVIDHYELDFELIESSESTMIAALDAAYEDEEPIVVTHWSPHWSFAEYDMNYLEDPDGVYGEEDSIYFMANADFDEEHSEVTELMNNAYLEEEELSELLALTKEPGSEAEGAQEWIDNNRDIVDEWLE
ncbi:glycine betaine ABC transporter substrate-binding protein [Shouchella shacheensis]|uniref:glycine betaine ABC transporter substrate-binding protein n=1 Tax=Shouchella shacheensis TaxID=1649580 RepID=UPI0007404E4C|nr:glycine betaine ABC transporter substrate-binding protein [Shouchella shacheensis]